MSIINFDYYKRKTNSIWNLLDNKIVIIDPGNGFVHLLNETGKCIFELLECQKNIDEIHKKIISTYEGINNDEIIKDIADYIKELLDCNLIEKGVI